MKSQAYTLNNYMNIPHIHVLSSVQFEAIKVVGTVFPFNASSLVVNELIDWTNINNDAMFKITFPQREMLNDEHYKAMKIVLDHTGDKAAIKRMVDLIRSELDPYLKGSQILEIQACVNKNRQAY